MKTAVAFIVFNRPDVTARVLAAIREARPPVLLVIADGPRAERPGEAEKCAQVRALVEAGVDWPCDVRRNYSEENLGCARRVSSGLDWVFSQVEEAIILEDDCLPDASFFPFCEELLERYCNDDRVAQIAGCSFLPAVEAEMDGYFFSRYPHCWGWATWRRAWAYYDHDMAEWREDREASWLIGPARMRERHMWSGVFDAVLAGAVDSWAYRWTAAVWSRGALSANARKNLVSNLGFHREATHTRSGVWGDLPLRRTALPLVRHPEVMEDEQLDALVGRRVFEPSPLWRRLIQFARRHLNA